MLKQVYKTKNIPYLRMPARPRRRSGKLRLMKDGWNVWGLNVKMGARD